MLLRWPVNTTHYFPQNLEKRQGHVDMPCRNQVVMAKQTVEVREIP